MYFETDTVQLQEVNLVWKCLSVGYLFCSNGYFDLPKDILLLPFWCQSLGIREFIITYSMILV